TVHSANPTTSFIEEVELRLRSAISAHSCTGYEILFRAVHTPLDSGYVQIVRWNGPVGNFTYIDTGQHNYTGIREGDVVKATIICNQITAYFNDVVLNSATDSTYSTGSPGMGFYNTGPIEANSDFGFTSFVATDGIASPTPTPTPRPTATPTPTATPGG